ncbi:CPBP family intramembrane glutamic endopeptidase [Clostridium massiliamazoniense]|uniref:CPBP family intramembrane glutamic endopeptidase n=1 Tax=Clostridium massiliamazoniense TaxID=1347366 RepID=UPI0006D860E6|nr:type II CAAX endopeptidase family protein [Clostridium massiliamazoniense]
MINQSEKVRRPILSSNLFFLAILLISIIVPIVLSPFLYVTLGLSQPVALIAAHFIMFVLPAIIYILITKQSFKEVLRLNKISRKEVLLSFALAFLAQPVMMFFSYIASFFVNNDVAAMLDNLSKTPLWLMVLMIGVTPAISEEITVRGIVLSGYKFKNKHIGAVMSGLMFGILHLNPHQFLYAFAMGVIFAYVVTAANSLIPAMIAHFTINTTQLLLQRGLISIQNSMQKVLTSVQDSIPSIGDIDQATQTLKEIPLMSKIGMGIFIGIFAIGAAYLISLIIKSMEKSKMQDVARVESENRFNARSEVVSEKVVNIPLVLIIIVYIAYMALIAMLK